MGKEKKLITISPEVLEDIRRRSEEGFNFSEWVELTYIKDKMGEKGLRIQQKNFEEMARKYKNMADYSAKKRYNLRKKLTSEQKLRRENVKKTLLKNPRYLNGQHRLWNDDYGTDLTKTEFIELLEGE